VITAAIAADGLRASGFMAVFVFGIMLGNKDAFGFKMGGAESQRLDQFVETTSFIMRLFFFNVMDPGGGCYSRSACRYLARHEGARGANDRLSDLHRHPDDDTHSGADDAMARRQARASGGDQQMLITVLRSADLRLSGTPVRNAVRWPEPHPAVYLFMLPAAAEAH